MQMKLDIMPIKPNFLGGFMNKLHIYFYLLLGINILFAKENKFAISGSVIDSEGNPIKKVVVQLFDDRGDEIKDSKTGKKGNFKFKKIKLGEYTITASHISLGSANEKISLIDDNISITFTLSSDTIPSKLAGNESVPEIIDEPGLKDNKKETKEEESKPSLLTHLKKPEDPINTANPDSIKFLPPIRTEPGMQKLPMGDMFYDYKMNLKAMQNQIDSLKSVVTAFEEKQTMPNISEDILNLINIPNYEHRIELQNGTVVMGHILSESDSSLILDTQIGKLVLRKDLVIKMDELEKPAPKIEFLQEPIVNIYPDKYIFTGKVKNTGNVRADFVRVISHLWTQTTTSAGTDSTFIKGSKIKYETGVVADTALQPEQISLFKLVVPINYGSIPQYHTMDIHWDVTK